MTTQTNLDLTDKQPTVLMRLEKIVNEMNITTTFKDDFRKGYNAAIEEVLSIIEAMKEPELADLKQAFCDGYVQTESAETWSKKWGVKEQLLIETK